MHNRLIALYPKPSCLWALSVLCCLGALRPTLAQSQTRLAACTDAVLWQGALPHSAEESVRYAVAVDGLNVGTVDFRIARTGMYAGKPAVEYRSLFKLDHLLATMTDIEGRAASLVPFDGTSPKTAMSHYSLGSTTWHEELAFGHAGRSLQVTRHATPSTQATIEADKTPPLAQPIVDFVTGFYMVRRLPAQGASCMTLYGNQHHYIVWATPSGTERVKTPIGMRPADVFSVRYQRIEGDDISSGRIWLSQTEERVPYLIQIDSGRRIEVRLHTYSMGRPQDGVKPPYSVAFD